MMNSSTQQIRLTRVNNSRAVAHKIWISTCSPRAPRTSRSSQWNSQPLTSLTTVLSTYCSTDLRLNTSAISYEHLHTHLLYRQKRKKTSKDQTTKHQQETLAYSHGVQIMFMSCSTYNQCLYNGYLCCLCLNNFSNSYIIQLPTLSEIVIARARGGT